MDNVLVIGSGGREHAICWKLAQSQQVKQIYAVPGNTGISQIEKVKCVDLNIKDHKSIAAWTKENNVTLVVVGPEDPLAAGIADVLRVANVNCFGPCKDAARIESDKYWAKCFMDRHKIPTARWGAFSTVDDAKSFIQSANFPALVVKASGLATEACEAADSILTDHKFGTAGNTIVVEELLEGEEVSVLAFVDGANIKIMLPSQDHKRHLDGDAGANTGGMGAYCPCPLISESELHAVQNEVLQKAVDGLKEEKTPFTGVLYAGLMMTKEGPKVLEFNCRFGDPETQVILSLLESDLFSVMKASCKGELDKQELVWKQNVYSVGVIMASRGYPESSSKGNVITGHEKVNKLQNHLVFHSGTALTPTGELVTNGGRVLIVIAIANELALATAKATKACKMIQFEGAQYRKDIAHKGIARSLLQKGELTYKASGVDITAGDSLVTKIKPLVSNTNRVGVMGSIGGFGGLFDTKAAGYKDPLLVSGTDGVGTKLKIAQACGIHSTVDVDVTTQVVAGVAEGCNIAGCALVGGETAEMPGLYAPGDYDLAGFAVGAVERTNLLPMTDKIKQGDTVIALPSSGVHSNGFSLVRKIMQKCGLNYSDSAPFSTSGKSYGEEFLTPTKIYVKSLLPALKSGKVKALAHITGGGLTENIPRILPKGYKVKLNANKWTVLPVFAWLAAAGGVSAPELLRTFNCGIGTVIIVNSSDVESVLKLISDVSASVVGRIEVQNEGDSTRVEVDNFEQVMDIVMRPYVKSVVSMFAPVRKKVGVLISGSGTNLQVNNVTINATTDLSKGIGAEIVLVISNKPGVQGLQRAQNAGIPTKVIKHTEFKSRLEFDMAMHAELIAAGVEIVCLAGFMRVLTGDFVKLWQGRLINIHPALLPLFKGTHAHRQALAAGVRITGCTAHFVEEDIDAGAILVQQSVQIEIGDTEETLQERVKLTEHKVFPEALRLVATEKVYLDEEGKLVWTK
ncbi:hypothetical protein L9F63_007394 [Diploptera punctata]|uniref:Trifunctional purine biosynthetic protein adenosine-3 n=1 Tax=Diploptera punctata TaxID=6984 RepID=A0AAD7Z868_DIPPU|nr:hypothetical protein L9F63_007394 [Diploptera punctata]